MTELTLLDAQLPAHIAAAFGAGNASDLSTGVGQSYPILSYRGKTWHIVEGDTRSLVLQPGTQDPQLSLEVVIIKANPALAKIYYPSGYVEGSTEKPTCYSNDSVAPALDAAEPQSVKCATCEHNQWGSKVTDDGAKGKACSDSRRLAVAPAGDLERVMLLRVPAASLKELAQFAEGLSRRQVPYQALITKVGFDHSVAYPKLVFSPVGWVNAAQASKIKEVMESDVVQAITALNAPVTTPAAEAALSALGPKPDHINTAADPLVEKTPKATKAKASQATVAEVSEIVQPAASATTGFGGGASVAAEPAAETPAEVLAAGAMSSLDALLSQTFDD